MKLTQLGLGAIVAVLAMISSVDAGCSNHCCCVCGKKVCTLEVSEEEEEVTCFDVEAKEICIPGIKFPWNCKRNCGGVRKVCVLKEVKKEKTVCKYDWSIKTICTTCCRRNGLRHHHANVNKPQANRDERIPFEFYAADAVEDQSSQSQMELPQTQSVYDVNSHVPFDLAFNRPVVQQPILKVPGSTRLESLGGSDNQVRSASATLLNIFQR